MPLLSKAFIDSYKDKPVPFGPLGYVTYKRTYAREIQALGRTEEWYETCGRVINGNFQLEIDHILANTQHESKTYHEQVMTTLLTEAEQAYDDMFHLRWLPSGRGLWMSGVETAKRNGAALTNCYFVEVKPENGKVSYPFVFAMDMLMLGAGVGFSVSHQHIQHIPKVSNSVDLYVVCDPNHRDFQFLGAQNSEGDWWNKTHQKIRLEDSREGWIYGFKKIIDASFLSKRGAKKSIVIDVSEIRASGEIIRGFGGRASGPAPLVELLRCVNLILNRSLGRHLSDVDVTDIMTNIGRCVVSGNVRRSAMIALGNNTTEFLEAKNPIQEYELDRQPLEFQNEVKAHNEAIQHHRWASNNSILIDSSFDPQSLADTILVKGEPGFLNLDLVQNYGRLIDGRCDQYDGLATGTNPCGEISLESYEPCNLSEIFPTNCSSFEEVLRVAKTAYRYAKRVTLSPYPWERSSAVVIKNRRLGVSISGIQDWVLEVSTNRHKWSVPGFQTPLSYLKVSLCQMYDSLKSEDTRFSKHLNINKSIKITTVKPSGTISLLAGVSPGVHYPYSAFYLRRIQFQENDPMVGYLKECGFEVTKAVQTPNAVVAHFPIKSEFAGYTGFRSAGEVSARDQLEFQEFIQTYWADNQVSCTVSIQKEDQEELPELIKEFAFKLKSTSFLPYTPALKDHYPDLPYEPITEAQYLEMLKPIKRWPERLENDAKQLDLLNVEECQGGACPIK